MNCCYEKKPFTHRQIEREIRNDKKRKRKEIQILLFGKHGSGKTTLFRQLQIIYGNKFSDEAKYIFTRDVYQNIFLAVQTLIDAMSTLKIPFAKESNKQLAEYISSIDIYDMKTLAFLEQAHSIKQIWADRGVQACYDRREEYAISSSAKYFLDSIERISRQDYKPSQQDMLMVDIPTEGLHEYTFEQRGYLFRVTDFKIQMYGMRRIWLQFFENIHVIMYVVDISEYNKRVEGTENENEVSEAKDLFKLVLSHPWFSRAKVVLFLNKIDLFKEKIKRYHLAEYFQEYLGPKLDSESAGEFIKQMFLDVKGQKGPVYPHFTCAVDTPGMTLVYDDVLQTVIESHLKRLSVL